VSVVSLDVFDTLLLRMTRPSAVAEGAAHRLSGELRERFGWSPTVAQIIEDRLDFVRASQSRRFGEESEWSVPDWLASLSERWDLDSETVRRVGIAAEIDAERHYNRLADQACKVVDAIKATGRRVVAVSDTSLTTTMLERLLTRFGLGFDAIFSSASLGLSKRKGGIFRAVEQDLGVAPRSILHVGDHWKADLIRPAGAGWRTLWLPRFRDTAPVRVGAVRRSDRTTGARIEAVGRALGATPAPQGEHPLFRLAYDALAPVLALFSIVQARFFRREGISVAFYMARDARAMFDVTEILRPSLRGFPESRYAYLSRRSITLAHPDNLLQSIDGLPGKAGKATIRELLSPFDLPEAVVSKILERAGVRLQNRASEGRKARLVRALKSLECEIAQLQSEQRTLVRDYLHQIADGASMRRIGIVDTGWAGTVQAAVGAALDGTEIIRGCYLGVSGQGPKPTTRQRKFGLLRDDFRRPAHAKAIQQLAGVLRVWDVLLQEPVGSVLRLQRRINGEITPTLAPFARPSESERLAQSAIRRGIRAGVEARVEGVRLLEDLSADWPDSIFEEAASALSLAIVSRPEREVARAIFQLTVEEGSAGGWQASIGLAGLGTGVVWYPGLLATFRARGAQPLLELAADLVARWRG
jgi:HAD superfamily hydrolase (TIGR01549 family)